MSFYMTHDIHNEIKSTYFMKSCSSGIEQFSNSVESRTEKLLSVRMAVRPYDATNFGQFLSDHFHIAYGTFYRHCECFYRERFLNRSSPLPTFWGIFGCFSQKLWGIGFSPFETFRFGFLYFWHL